MINGVHAIVFRTDVEADRGFLRDVLDLPNVDVGQGWLIFGLPPAEIAVHPDEQGNRQELYLMCEDIEQFVSEVRQHGLAVDAVSDEGWGLVTQLTLPGGGSLGVYEPTHARPPLPAS